MAGVKTETLLQYTILRDAVGGLLAIVPALEINLGSEWRVGSFEDDPESALAALRARIERHCREVDAGKQKATPTKIAFVREILAHGGFRLVKESWIR